MLLRSVRRLLAAVLLWVLPFLGAARLAAQQPTPLPPGGGQVVPLACVEGEPCGTPQNALDVSPDAIIEPIRSPGSGTFSLVFTVTRVSGPASQPAFSFGCAGRNGVTCTSQSLNSAVLPLGQPVDVTVTYTTGGPTEEGRVVLIASGGTVNGGTASDSGWVVVPVVSYGVAVTPDGGTQTRGVGDATSQLFTVRNTGSRPASFTLSCSINNSAVLGACGAPAGTPELAPNQSTTITLTPPALAAGTATISLNASGTNASDGGTLAVTVVRYGVSVTPDGGTVARGVGDAQGQVFTIRNTGSASATFALSCAVGNPSVLGSCSVPGTTGDLPPDGSAQITVTPAALAAGSATLTVTAVGTNATDGGSVTMEVTRYGVAVTPDGGAASVAVGQVVSRPFTVLNTGSAPATFTLSCYTGNIGILDGCSVPAQVGPIPGGGSVSVTVTANALAAGLATLNVAASGDRAYDEGFVTAAVTRYGVSVTPVVGTLARIIGDGQQHAFTVTNTGSSQQDFALTCSALPATVLGGCGVVGGTGQLASGAATTISVSAAALAGGAGTVGLTAAIPQASASGSMAVTISAPPGILAVTPDNTTLPGGTLYDGYRASATYTVSNTGGSPVVASLQCLSRAPTAVTCDSISRTVDTLAAGASRQIMAWISAVEPGGTTTLTTRLVLLATAAGTSDSGYQRVSVAPRVLTLNMIDVATIPVGENGGSTKVFLASDAPTPGSINLTCRTLEGVGSCSFASKPSLLLPSVPDSAVLVYALSGSAPGRVIVEGQLGVRPFSRSADTLVVQRATPPTTWTVAAVPGTASAVAGGDVQSSVFRITSGSAQRDSVAPACRAPDGIECLGVVPAQVALDPGASADVTVRWRPVNGIGGALVLDVSNSRLVGSGTLGISMTTPTYSSSMAVTRDSASWTAPVSTSGLVHRFRVANTGTGALIAGVTCAATGPVACRSLSTDTLVIAGGETRFVFVTFDVLATQGAGSLTLTATAGALTASSTLPLTATAAPAQGQQAPSIALAPWLRDSTLARSECLSFSVAAGAAVECGDLRVVRALPAVRTLGKGRAPALLYLSSHAEPRPTVSVDITRPRTATAPTRYLVLLRRGTTLLDSASYTGTQWTAAGQTRRVALQVDATTWTTGLHAITVEVQARYGTTTALGTTVSGRLPVVNRRASPFGLGWWVAGLEALQPDSMVWVGGDGSVMRFRQVSAGRWEAPAVTEPNVIVADGGGYARLVKGGVRVRFDAQGRHTQTVNRLGHTTGFQYDGSGRLSRLTVPGRTTTLTYEFHYSAAGRLDSVVAPHLAALRRVVRLERFSGTDHRVRRLIHPDGLRDSLTYVGTGATGRIARLVQRDSTVDLFTYAASGQVQRAARRVGAGTNTDSTTHAFVHAEARGFRSGTPTSAAPAQWHTLYDGPRLDADVRDTLALTLTRFGGVERVLDATGRVSTIERGDARWPALPTRTVMPGGRVSGITYDTRANAASSTDSTRWRVISGAASQSVRYATVTATYDPVFDLPLTAVSPEGETTVMQRDPATGNVLTVEDARGAPSRQQFSYDALTGLLFSTRAPDGAVDSLGYDAQGNVVRQRSALGTEVLYTLDALGRDLGQSVPMDYSGSPARRQTTTIERDIMDRETRRVTSGPAITVPGLPGNPDRTIPAKSLEVITTYDAMHRVRTVRTTPTPANPGFPSLETRYTYDLGGRRTEERAPDGGIERFVYDRAGNLIERITRRGQSIRMAYDALGRLTQRIIPSTVWQPFQVQAGVPHAGVIFPRFRPTADGSLDQPSQMGTLATWPGDTVVMAYDVAGNLIRADNHDARISRSYTRSGDLASETQRVRTYADTGFTAHVYTQRWTYDLSGRRVTHDLPAVLTPDSLLEGRAPRRWEYDIAGQLVRVVGTGDEVGAEFTWNFTGGLLRTRNGDMLEESQEYDLEGRVIARRDGVHQETYAYDPLGRRVGVLAGANAQVQLQYDGLGAAAFQRMAGTYFGARSNVLVNDEFTRTDALGNALEVARSSWSTQLQVSPPGLETFSYTPTGRLATKSGSVLLGGNMAGQGLNMTVAYDSAGNRVFQEELQPLPNQQGADLRTLFVYDAEQRLRLTDRRACVVVGSTCQPDGVLVGEQRDVVEEHRYDALGRRVLTRMRTEAQCAGECGGVITRYIWDGDQLLGELAAQGSTTTPAAQRELDGGNAPSTGTLARVGRVRYLHGVGLDAPLQIRRWEYSTRLAAGFTWLLQRSWRGGVDAVTSSGVTCYIDEFPLPRPPQDSAGFGGSVTTCAQIRLEEAAQWLGHARVPGATETQSGVWHGSLLGGQRDASGLQYKRNRFYDPATGAFTQEDPIGLAGGLNVYGYAGGDAVNLSDPFGLSPDCSKFAARARKAFIICVLSQNAAERINSLGTKVTPYTDVLEMPTGSPEAPPFSDGSVSDRVKVKVKSGSRWASDDYTRTGKPGDPRPPDVAKAPRARYTPGPIAVIVLALILVAAEPAISTQTQSDDICRVERCDSALQRQAPEDKAPPPGEVWPN